MRYVQRDGNGNVIGVYRWPWKGIAEERLADDHADILAFRTRMKPKPPLEADILAKALLDKGVLTKADIDAASAAQGR